MSEIYGNVVKCFAYLSVILELSKGREITGYDILDHVSSFGLAVSAGTVYHQLGMLKKVGLVEAKRVRRGRSYKKVYTMTEKGIEVFREFRKIWRKPLEYAYKNL